MTRTFNIEINGISLSIDAVQALTNRLNQLEDRLESLSDADTVNLRTSLEEVRRELSNQDADWDSITNHVNELNDEVLNLERSYRNIHNPLNAQDIRNYTQEVESLEGSISDVARAADRIDGIDDLDDDLDDASRSANNLANNLNRAVLAGNELDTSITANIGGVAVQFDDVNQGIGIMEDRLYQLAASGQLGSDEFRLITEEIVRMRTAVLQVDDEIDNTFSGGLNRLVEGVSGFAAIGSIGEGLALLFGGTNQELEETMQKFAGLSLVLQGVLELQRQLNDQASLTTRVFRAMSSVADPFAGGVANAFNRVFPFFERFNNYATQMRNLDLQYQMESLARSAQLDDRNLFAWDDLNSRLQDISLSLGNISTQGGLQSLFTGFADVSGITREILQAFDGGLIDQEQFDSANQAVEQLRGWLTDDAREAGRLREQLRSLNVILGDVPLHLTRIQRSSIAVSRGIRLIGTAFKSLLKATLILGALQLAMEGISWLFEKLGDAWKWIAGDDTLITQFDSVKNAIDATNSSLERYIDNLLKLQNTNVISAATRIEESIAEYERALKSAIERQKEFNEVLEPEPLEEFFETWANGTTWFSDGIWNMDQFKKRYDELLLAVESGTDIGKNWFSSIWFTSDDAKADLAILQKALIEDLESRINNIDLSKGTEEVKSLIDVINNPMYAQAIANLENLYPEDKGKVLAANIKAIKDYYKLILDLQNEAAKEQLATNDKIQDNNIAAIKDRLKREREEFEKNYQRELRDAADNEKLKESITNKYNTLRGLMLKNQAKELRDIQNSIEDNKIAAMEDGFKKLLAELEHQRQLELDAAKDSEILVGELSKAINDKYDKLILKAKIEFLKNRNDVLKKYNAEYWNLYKEINELEYEIAESKISNRYKDRAEALGFTEESIDNIRDYYYKIRDIQNEEAKKQAKIDSEKSDIDSNIRLKLEVLRNKDRIEEIKEDYKKGLTNKEEYDKALEDESNMHYRLMLAITHKGEQDLINILRESNETSKNNNITAINEVVNALSDAFSKIKVETETNSIGIIDYKKTKDNLDKAKDEYSKIFGLIKTERDNLLQAFDKGKITFNDFREAKGELDDLEDQVKDAEKSVNSQLNSLFTEVAKSITQYVGQYVNVLGGLWSTFNEILMMKLDLEKARLDEELDMLEKAYSKQEELTLKHVDKLSEIEDELKTARGDRRAHLIEQLNAERAAQLASLQEQLRIEKLKEANERKQDALEKKRREQEKKNSIVQAMINTYTAVTNALAVQPWFVGVALSSVALAMGLAQVSMISKLKYAKGGLLKGASHNNGGIPVGNTGIEVEGDEYVVNKRSTKANLPLIDYINNSKRPLTRLDLMSFYDSGKKNILSSTSSKFADGGLLPNLKVPSFDNQLVITDDRPVVVLVVDIVNKANDYKQVQVLAGLDSNKTF